MLSHKFIKLASFFFIFATLIGSIPLPWFRVCWFFLLLVLVWCWISLLNIPVRLLYYSALWFLFGTFKYSVSCNYHFVCSPDLNEYRYDHYFELSIESSYLFISLRSNSEDLSLLLFGIYSISSFSLIFSVCFCTSEKKMFQCFSFLHENLNYCLVPFHFNLKYFLSYLLLGSTDSN